jgi:hypothetical protein
MELHSIIYAINFRRAAGAKWRRPRVTGESVEFILFFVSEFNGGGGVTIKRGKMAATLAKKAVFAGYRKVKHEKNMPYFEKIVKDAPVIFSTGYPQSCSFSPCTPR